MKIKNSRKREIKNKNKRSKKSNIRNNKIETTSKKNRSRKNNIRNKKIETTLFLKNKSRSKLKMEKGGMNSSTKALVATGLAVAAGAIYLLKSVVGQDVLRIREVKASDEVRIEEVTGSDESLETFTQSLNQYTSELFFKEFNYIGKKKYDTLQQVVNILKTRIEEQVGGADSETAPESVGQTVLTHPDITPYLLRNLKKPMIPPNRDTRDLYFATFPLFPQSQLLRQNSTVDMKILKLFFEFENELSLVYKIKEEYHNNKSWMIIHFIDNILKSLQQDSAKKEEEILEDIGLHQEYEFLTSIIKKYQELPDAFSEEYVWKIFDDLEEEPVKEKQVEKHPRSIEEKFLRIMIYCNLKMEALPNEIFRPMTVNGRRCIELIQLTGGPVVIADSIRTIRQQNPDFSISLNPNEGYLIKGILIFGNYDVEVDFPDLPFNVFNEADFSLVKVDNIIDNQLSFCYIIKGLQGTKITSDTFKECYKLKSVDLTGTDISEAVNLTYISKIRKEKDLSDNDFIPEGYMYLGKRRSELTGLFCTQKEYLTITGLKDLKLPPVIFSGCKIESINLTDCDISEAQYLFYYSSIKNIIGLQNVTRKKLPQAMFYNSVFEISTLNLTDIDISEASYLFAASNITKNMLTQLDTIGGNKKLPPYIFYRTKTLDSFNVSILDISNATGMFSYSNISKVTGLNGKILPEGMFKFCKMIISIDLTGAKIDKAFMLFSYSNIENVIGLSGPLAIYSSKLSIFFDCHKLKLIDLSNYDNLLDLNLRSLFFRTNINQTNINNNIVQTKDNKVLNTKEIKLLLSIK